MTFDPAILNNSKFAILIFGTDDNGEDEAFACDGRAVYSVENDRIDIFKEDVEQAILTLPRNEFDLIEKVNEDVKDIVLGADYMIVLNIKPLPDDADTSNYEKLGFKYPGYEGE